MISSIPSEILSVIKHELKIEPSRFSFSGGGCINQGGKLETKQGACFLKWNDARAFPGMFEKEAKGLLLLQETKSIRVPRVIHSAVVSPHQFLLMEYIETGKKTNDFWKDFGKKLAHLHGNTAGSFGLDHDNFIGSLAQVNRPLRNGIDFFIQNRLEIQLELATRSSLVERNIQKKFEKLYHKLPDLIPDEKPALIHGDLWGGNLMTDENGDPCLIDPAVYYGFREADLAMTTLFGGFDNNYLPSYNEFFPLVPGFRERFRIYNLYPLLVHVNLFGKSYVSQVVSILNDFV